MRSDNKQRAELPMQVLTDAGLIQAALGRVDQRFLTGKGDADVIAMLRAVESAALQSPQVQVLRKDAQRYRLLRRGQRWSVINGIGDVLRADALDGDIDAAIDAKPVEHAPQEAPDDQD